MSRKQILLIYPIIGKDIKFHWMPTSLIAVSSKLDSYGYPVKIIDERIFDKKKFRKIVLKETKNALLVGFSVMTGYQIYGAIRTSKLIKSVYPNMPIVWGGDHPTVAPYQVIELSFVNMVVIGQGEKPLFEIITHLERQKTLAEISGLIFKQHGNIIQNSYRRVYELDPYYPLPYHLLNVGAYINPATRAFNYFSSLGCLPGKCQFCNTRYSYPGWRFVSSEKVVLQIASLVKEYHFRNCIFQDSNFFVSESRVVEICELLLKRNINIKWNASGRADQLSRYSDATFDLLVKAGCICFFIGVESGSQRMLDKMGKTTCKESMVELSKRIKSLPIDLHISLIFGLPYEKIEDLVSTVKYVEKLKKINSRIKVQKCFFTPYPRTSLYKEVLKLGYIPPKDIYGWIEIEQSSDFIDVPWMNNNIKKEYRKIFEENFREQERTEFKL